MTDKPTPTDAELEALLLDKLPASKHYIRPVIEKMVAAMQAAIDKCGQPAQKTVTVVPATGDVWLKHDDDLRYVRRVLEAGRQMTDVDQGAAIDMVQALRVTSAINGSCDTKKPAQAAEPFGYVHQLPSGSEVFARTRDFYHNAVPVFTTPHPTQTQAGALPLTDEQTKALMQAHRTAMLMTCKARVPECGEFAAIAQDLDWLCESLGIKGGQHD